MTKYKRPLLMEDADVMANQCSDLSSYVKLPLDVLYFDFRINSHLHFFSQFISSGICALFPLHQCAEGRMCGLGEAG